MLHLPQLCASEHSNLLVGESALDSIIVVAKTIIYFFIFWREMERLVTLDKPFVGLRVIAEVGELKSKKILLKFGQYLPDDSSMRTGNTSVICGSDLMNLARALPARLLAFFSAFFAALASGGNRRRAFESIPRGMVMIRVDGDVSVKVMLLIAKETRLSTKNRKARDSCDAKPC